MTAGPECCRVCGRWACDESFHSILGQTTARPLAVREAGEALRNVTRPAHVDSDGDWKEGHGPGRCDGCDALIAYDAAAAGRHQPPRAGEDRHTPGPWKFDLAPRKHTWPGLYQVDTDILAWGYDGEEGIYINNPADARLIAAAPDLFVALERLYVETADYITINNLGHVHHNMAMQMARDALVKAGSSRAPASAEPPHREAAP